MSSTTVLEPATSPGSPDPAAVVTAAAAAAAAATAAETALATGAAG